jgi:hypothetical protein
MKITEIQVYPTQVPGPGVTFNAEAATDAPAEVIEPPHLHRPDGLFTNYSAPGS